jgi:hypothetical protein
MTTLILAGTTILAASDTVTDLGDRYATADAHYPKHVVTDVVDGVTLPGGFCISKYKYEEGQLVSLPDPDPVPPTKEEAQKLLAELDEKFDPRWFEDLVTGSPMHDRYVAWSSRREELREIIRNG